MKYIRKNKWSSMICVFVFMFLIGCKSKPALTEFEDNFYVKLERELEDTKTRLKGYINNISSLAGNIRKDEVMTSFFMAKKEYYALQKSMEMPESFAETIERLKEKIQNHYLINYLSFHDILFVDKNGDIFYTIRKEKDYHKNIFEDELGKTALSKKLNDNPGESYVDFQFYEVSGEPSAFFIEPVVSENKTEGWFVL